MLEAQQIIQQHLPPLKTETVALPEALNRVLAEEVLAPEDSPRFDNSAMDGFALRWEDVAAASPRQAVLLQIIGESSAGKPFSGSLSSGQAVRISTGAVVPEGADTVVPLEDCREIGGRVEIGNPPKRFQHVRFIGEEFKKGDLLMPAGTILKPPHLAVLSSVGVQRIRVFGLPRVVIFATGNELIPFHQQPRPGQIRDSNSLMLASSVREAGGRVVHRKIIKDDRETTVGMLKEAASAADVVLFSGGVSVGPHDHVKQAAETVGFRSLFWKVNQKPGKPLFFARKGDVLLFGLPGNPVSAYMCFLYYVFPVLKKLRGENFHWEKIKARSRSPVTNRTNRDQLMRVRLHSSGEKLPQFNVLEKQGSHMLTSLTGADGFIILPAKKEIGEGEELEIFLFP